MKRDSGLMQFTSSIVLALFFAGSLVSCSSGGGGGAAPATSLTSADQAVEAAGATTGIIEFTGALAIMAMDIGMDNLPLAAERLKSVKRDNLAKLDPRLQKLAEGMAKLLQAPALKAAVKKARALGASLAPVNETIACDSGTIVMTGTDNSNVMYEDFDITFTFNACRDNDSYTELTGSLRVQMKRSPSSYALTLIATNFTDKTYTSNAFLTLLSTSALNATFSDTLADSGTFNANGTFTQTYYPDSASVHTQTIKFNNLSAVWSWAEDTETTTVNGGFGFTDKITVNSVVTDDFGLDVSFSNFKVEWVWPSSTEEQVKYNGRVTINYTPDVAGCVEGVFDLTTPADKPLRLTSADWYNCPVSGTLMVNNATIEFGKPVGKITVTVGTQTPVVYDDCDDLGGICVAF